MIVCPKCKSLGIVKNGRRLGYQMYECGRCRFQFTLEIKALDERIRKIRVTLNITIKELANHLRVAPDTLARWESGATKIPRKPQLAQITNMERQLEQGETVVVAQSRYRLGPSF